MKHLTHKQWIGRTSEPKSDCDTLTGTTSPDKIQNRSWVTGTTVMHALKHIYCMLDHHSALSAAPDRVFNYCFRVCLPSQASELRRSWTRKWNSFLSACPDTDCIYQLSYGTKHSFNAIYLVYLWLGGGLRQIKSAKSVCGLIVATIKRNDWNCIFAGFKLSYCLHWGI